MKVRSFAFVHVFFSTRKQKPLITEKIRGELYSYMGFLCQKHKCRLMTIGGTEDHVHLLIRLHHEVALTTLVESIKEGSEETMKGEGLAWQESWFGFTVSPEELKPLEKYIEHQDEQHEVEDFKDEARRLCRENGVKGDEKEMWE